MQKSNLFLSMLAVVAFFGLAFTTPTEIDTLKVDVANSVVNWTGYKVTGQHTGTLSVKEGNLEFDGTELTGGNFVLDMASIAVTDLEGKMKGKLEGHLKSGDFFGVEKFPTANFTITKVISRGKAGEYKINGDLTIKETTKPIKFNAIVSANGKDAKAVADITIDRSDFDVKYGSGSFFDDLGDKTIYDEFELKVILVASK